MAKTKTAKAPASITPTKHAVDFSNVKESSGINPKHQPEGDYLLKIIKVEETLKDEVPMWNFHCQAEDLKSAVYPFYCKLQENQLWKLRNLLIAVGIEVPKKRVGIDPNKLIGKIFGATLEDDEYEGKPKSVIAATFPASELDAKEPEDDDDDEDEDEAPAPKAKKKGKAAPEPEPVKGKAKKAEADDEMDIDDL